jgi:hypothetical protein
MRKSIIAGMMLCTALAVAAGQAQAGNDKDGTPSARRSHHDGRKAHRVAEMPAAPFRLPAHPIVRDCVHVVFPQCGRGFDALNDGDYHAR